MKTISIVSYSLEIQAENFDPVWVDICIIDDDLTLQVVIDSWLDAYQYYSLSTEEFANLKVGDELDEGTRVLSIDPKPTFHSVSYLDFEYASNETLSNQDS
jgi:hypothetical protein